MGYQAAGDGQDLLLAARELAGRQVLSFSQDGELLHQAIDLSLDGVPVTPDPRAEIQVLPNGQPGEDLAAFRDLDQPLADDFLGRTDG